MKTFHGKRRLLGGTCLAVPALAGLVLAGFTLSPAYGQDSDSTPSVQSEFTSAVVGFNPGMIISDEVFYNPNTMDANAIQQFLNAKGRACQPGVDTITILAPQNHQKGTDGPTLASPSPGCARGWVTPRGGTGRRS